MHIYCYKRYVLRTFTHLYYQQCYSTQLIAKSHHNSHTCLMNGKVSKDPSRYMMNAPPSEINWTKVQLHHNNIFFNIKWTNKGNVYSISQINSGCYRYNALNQSAAGWLEKLSVSFHAVKESRPIGITWNWFNAPKARIPHVLAQPYSVCGRFLDRDKACNNSFHIQHLCKMRSHVIFYEFAGYEMHVTLPMSEHLIDYR